MQNPSTPGGYWSAQFPDYTIRMAQMAKMFRIMQEISPDYPFIAAFSLVPKV